jgi:hypothetical protein
LRDANDFPNAFTYAEWIRRSFPAMPFWFPYQGAGISPSSAYAVAPAYAVAGLAWAGIDLVLAARVLAFLTFPFGALGVAACGRALGLQRSASFAAGAFALLPPAAWNLTVYGGLYANAFAAALVPWALASMVAYARLPEGRLSRWGAVLFVSAATSTGLAFVAHPVVAVAPLGLAALTALGVSWTRLRRIVAVAFGAVLMSVGVLYAFIEYTSATLGGAAASASTAVLGLDQPSLGVLLGLLPPPAEGLANSLSLTPFLCVIGGLGVLAAARGLPFRGLALATLLSIAFIVFPEIGARLESIPRVGPLLSARGFLIFAVIGVSILAASSVQMVAGLRRIPLARVALPVMVLAALVVLEGQGYGPHLPGKPAFIRERLPALMRNGFPPTDLLAGPAAFDPTRGTAVRAALDGVTGRADLSPRLGDLLVGLFLASDARVAPAYTHTLVLFPQSSADRNQALFDANEYGVAGASVAEVSAWFGIDRVLLGATDDTQRFAAARWTLNASGDPRYATSPQIHAPAAFRQRGTVLHVGRVSGGTYRNAYRFATAGALPFALGWLVEGPECIDDVPVKELQRFDALILDDHCERGPSAAGMIETFVRDGGRLFVETGWEYSPEFQATSAATFLPVDSLSWRAVGKRPTIALPASGIDVTGIAPADIGDFEYSAATWNVSAPADSRLRSGARAVLTADGTPLIAVSQLGRGRVVWSGMNLISHAIAKDRAAERVVFRRLFDWLLDGATTVPQEMEVTHLAEDGGDVQAPMPGWILWRESPAYAQVTPSPGRLYRAGPGMLLAPLEGGRYAVRQSPSVGMRVATISGGLASVLSLLWLSLALRAGGAADPSGVFSWLARGAVARLPRIELRESDE